MLEVRISSSAEKELCLKLHPKMTVSELKDVLQHCGQSRDIGIDNCPLPILHYLLNTPTTTLQLLQNVYNFIENDHSNWLPLCPSAPLSLAAVSSQSYLRVTEGEIVRCHEYSKQSYAAYEKLLILRRNLWEHSHICEQLLCCQQTATSFIFVFRYIPRVPLRTFQKLGGGMTNKINAVVQMHPIRSIDSLSVDINLKIIVSELDVFMGRHRPILLPQMEETKEDKLQCFLKAYELEEGINQKVEFKRDYSPINKEFMWRKPQQLIEQTTCKKRKIEKKTKRRI